MTWSERAGSAILGMLAWFGGLSVFGARAVRDAVRPPFEVGEILRQMFDIGWIMDYPDPEDVLDILFHSTSRQNNSRYKNPEVDQKLEQARVEQDTERRLELYQEVERTILQDAAWIPLYFGTTHALVKPYVRNYFFPGLVIERFREVEVDR